MAKTISSTSSPENESLTLASTGKEHRKVNISKSKSLFHFYVRQLVFHATSLSLRSLPPKMTDKTWRSSQSFLTDRNLQI